MPELAHLFDAHRARDPTGTAKLRRAYRAEGKLRMRQARANMRQAVMDLDVLGLGAGNFEMMPRDARLRAFSDWLGAVVGRVLLSDSWQYRHISRAWRAGELAAVRELARDAMVNASFAHVDELARIEMMGIAAAVAQRVAREAASIITTYPSKHAAWARLAQTFDAVGPQRISALADVTAVKAFNGGKVAVYKAADIKQVGVIAEMKPIPHVHDALPPDLLALVQGVGEAARYEEEPIEVGVRTAGDFLVCQNCEDYAEGAPYDIDEVEDALPLHPNCRCTWYPWDDKRFKHDAFDPSQPRDEFGRWTAVGGERLEAGVQAFHAEMNPVLEKHGFKAMAMSTDPLQVHRIFTRTGKRENERIHVYPKHDLGKNLWSHINEAGEIHLEHGGARSLDKYLTALSAGERGSIRATVEMGELWQAAKSGKPEALKQYAEVMQKRSDRIAQTMMVDPSKVKVVTGATKKSGYGTTLASTDDHTGNVTMFARVCTPQAFAGTLVHELTHVKYKAMRNAYRKEKAALDAELNNLSPAERAKAQNEDGTLNGKLAEKYPIYSEYTALWNIPELQKEGGVSDYSKHWWAQTHTGKNASSAVYETTAEMARIKYETGTLPGGPRHQALYTLMNSVWYQQKPPGFKMIEQAHIDGRDAMVAWLTHDFRPANKHSADMAKVIYDDGDVQWFALHEHGLEDRYDPNELRDPRGRWTEGGGGEEAGDEHEHPGEAYSASARVVNGVIHTGSVYDAQRALFENRKVELKHIREVSTLIDRLGETARKMAEHGEAMPKFNLCNVSIKGTNLFCAESKGIPRVEMPVIKAKATKEFVKYLKSRGYKTEKSTERADHLRSTQDELDGAKVAFNMGRIAREGFYKRIMVSRDGYILDGHHTWAAQLGVDARDGSLKGDKTVRITRVNISITKLLAEANTWTGGKGKKALGQDALDYNPDQPRAEPGVYSAHGGEFTSGGGGGGGGEGSAEAKATEGNTREKQGAKKVGAKAVWTPSINVDHHVKRFEAVLDKPALRNSRFRYQAGKLIDESKTYVPIYLPKAVGSIGYTDAIALMRRKIGESFYKQAELKIVKAGGQTPETKKMLQQAVQHGYTPSDVDKEYLAPYLSKVGSVTKKAKVKEMGPPIAPKPAATYTQALGWAEGKVKAGVKAGIPYSQMGLTGVEVTALQTTYGSVTEYVSKAKSELLSGKTAQEQTASMIKAQAVGKTFPEWKAEQQAAQATIPVAMPAWKKVGVQMGSVSGGMYEDPSGKTWYVKTPKTEDHVNADMLANRLYKIAGVAVADQVKTVLDGKPAVASRILPGLMTMAQVQGKLGKASVMEHLRKDFAVDAWLGNRDVVGLELDNVLANEDGQGVHRIDFGASLMYRAQGAEKPFGSIVEEINTMRNPTFNEQSAAVFSPMSSEEIAASIDKVLAIPNDVIMNEVKAHGMPASLAMTLIDRKEWLGSFKTGLISPDLAKSKAAAEKAAGGPLPGWTPALQSEMEAEEEVMSFTPPKATVAELEKAKKTGEFYPKPQMQTAQALVAEWNKKWATKADLTPQELEQKVAEYKITKSNIAGIEANYAALQKAKEAEANAAQAAAQAAAKAKENAAKSEAKAALAKLAADLGGISESDAKAVDALISLSGVAPQTLVKQFNDYQKSGTTKGMPVSPFEYAMIESYVGSGYTQLNGKLREGVWDVKTHLFAQAVNKALAKMPPWNKMVKRGMNVNATDLAKWTQVGNIVEHRNFASCGKTSSFSGNLQLHIKPLGTPTSHMRDLGSFNEHEKGGEVLGMARTQFLVDRFEKQGSETHVWVSEVESI